MATARQAIDKAKSWNGIKEGPEADRIIIDPWNKKTGCHAKSKTTAWCAIFIASLLLQIKAAGYSLSAYCKTQRAYYKRNKRWIDPPNRPAAGYIIFITGHEGIVTSTSYNGTGKYTSGNSANKVRTLPFNWKTGKAGKKKILGYGIPKYTK